MQTDRHKRMGPGSDMGYFTCNPGGSELPLSLLLGIALVGLNNFSWTPVFCCWTSSSKAGSLINLPATVFFCYYRLPFSSLWASPEPSALALLLGDTFFWPLFGVTVCCQTSLPYGVWGMLVTTVLALIFPNRPTRFVFKSHPGCSQNSNNFQASFISSIEIYTHH